MCILDGGGTLRLHIGIRTAGLHGTCGYIAEILLNPLLGLLDIEVTADGQHGIVGFVEHVVEVLEVLNGCVADMFLGTEYVMTVRVHFE